MSSHAILRPSIVGSLPKPAWLAEPNVLRAPWRLSGAALPRRRTTPCASRCSTRRRPAWTS